ncbi:hypothetical protein AAMO2058_000498600 [Amorphochlora amoebiformis]
MSVLPREVLKWIQSLDLTYSVRNVKRDFANGFLVAEILFRFREYSQEINMHSFDNGTAIKRRKDNWDQLLRVFKKRGIPIDEDLANAVLHCKSIAACQMVEKLYSHLTKRTIVPVETVIEEKPAYARPTASKLVRERLKEPEALERNDEHANIVQAKETIDQHQMQLRQDRMNDRDRYGYTSKHHRKVVTERTVRVPPRQVKHDEFKQPQIQFEKNVSVKPISEEMVKLKASQQLGTGNFTVHEEGSGHQASAIDEKHDTEQTTTSSNITTSKQSKTQLPSAEETSTLLADVLDAVLLKDAPSSVIQNGILKVSDCLPISCPSRIASIFMKLIISVPKEVQEALLTPESPNCIPRRNALRIAAAVCNDLQQKEMKNLADVHIQLLNVSVFQSIKFESEWTQEWRAILQGLIRYVIVELLDDRRCDWASKLLARFFTDDVTREWTATLLLKPENQKAPKFFAFLKMAYPSSSAKIQTNIESFLRGLASTESLFADVYNLLKNFQTAEPTRTTEGLNTLVSELDSRI